MLGCGVDDFGVGTCVEYLAMACEEGAPGVVAFGAPTLYFASFACDGARVTFEPSL